MADSSEGGRSRRRKAMVINFEDVRRIIEAEAAAEPPSAGDDSPSAAAASAAFDAASSNKKAGAEEGLLRAAEGLADDDEDTAAVAAGSSSSSAAAAAVEVDTADAVGEPQQQQQMMMTAVAPLSLPPQPTSEAPQPQLLPPPPNAPAPVPKPSRPAPVPATTMTTTTTPTTTMMTEAQHAEMHYRAFLAMAQREDFGDLDRLEFLYRSGYDQAGRTILVLIGCNLPARRVPLERLFLYFIRTLDPVVERDYVVVYVAANQSSENRPSFTWLRRVYALFNRKYKKNLKKLYIVRATAWLRMVMGLFRPFVSKKFWVKLVYVPTIAGIFDHLSPQQLHFPGAFMEKVTAMKPVFGEPLERVLQTKANAGLDIPLVVSQCLHYLFEKALDLEGVLRVPGDRAQMNEYRMAFDAGKPVDFEATCMDPHTVVALFKLYLRELPEPLLTYALYDPLVRSQSEPGLTPEERMRRVEALLAQLPRPNKVLLWHVITFAAELTRHQDKNKMTAVNVAVCLGPTLMWRRPEEIDPAIALQEMPMVNNVLKLLLDHREILPVDFQPAALPAAPSTSAPSPTPTQKPS